MLYRSLILVFVLFFYLQISYAQGIKYPKITIPFGSFLQHLEPAVEGADYVQHFGNHYYSVNIRVTRKTYLTVGTGLNSYGHQLFLLGVNHIWHSFTRRLHLEGTYTYAGEFFFEAFANAGKDGIYNSFKEAIGIGAVPMIYHGFKYNFLRHLSFKLGLIAPSLILSSLEISIFRLK